MKRSWRTWGVRMAVVSWAVTAWLQVGRCQEEAPRELIGAVLGKPVYRDQIRSGKGFSLSSELHRLFTTPVMQEYRQQHEAAITPTPAEIATATAYFDQRHAERIRGKELELRRRLKVVEEQLQREDIDEDEEQLLKIERQSLQSRLKPPGRRFAVFMLDKWKMQRHLYDEFGGGRILWQQAGLEAFDAMHQWLKTQEQQEKIRIADPALRNAYYAYWTTMKHGSFLVDDEERIRREFLQPAWLGKDSERD